MEANLPPQKSFLPKFSFGLFIKIHIFEDNPKSNFINWVGLFIFGLLFLLFLVDMSTAQLVECKVFPKGKSVVRL